MGELTEYQMALYEYLSSNKQEKIRMKMLSLHRARAMIRAAKMASAVATVSTATPQEPQTGYTGMRHDYIVFDEVYLEPDVKKTTPKNKPYYRQKERW